MHHTAIIIPCYNESCRFKAAEFYRFAGQRANVKFLLVNDGSRDDTLKLLNQLAAADPAHFEVLDLADNVGKAEAVRRGVLHAAVDQPATIGFWDADLATPLSAIADFAAVLEKQPHLLAVIGARIPLLGRDIRRQPVRAWLGAEFSQVVSLVLGRRFHDTQCGAKLFRCAPQILAAFSQPFSSRWIFDVELLARLKQLTGDVNSRGDFRQFIYEFPLDRWEDVAGSKLKRGDFFKAISELAVIWWRYLRPAAPKFTPAPMPTYSVKETSRETRRAA